MTESQRSKTLSPIDDVDKVRFDDLLSVCPTLTVKEKEILTLVYLCGYSSVEIANKFSSSKQNINQIKRRALQKMKSAMLSSSF